MSLMERIFPAELKLPKLSQSINLGNLITYLIIYQYQFYQFYHLFEKIMYNNVVNVMDKNDTFHKYQFVFRNSHSTQHDIITLVEKITCFVVYPLPCSLLVGGGGTMFLLVVHQSASPSIWPAVQSLRRGLSTNPRVTMWCVCGCS